MKDRRGFTLIELLAVIVLLAIIMIIAVPRILDVIEKAEMQAYKESVEIMVKTAKIQYEASEVKNEAIPIPQQGLVYEYSMNGTETIQTDESINTYGLLNFKGDKPSSGTIILTQNKKVIVTNLVSKNQKWCAEKDENENTVRVGKMTELGCSISTNQKYTVTANANGGTISSTAGWTGTGKTATKLVTHNSTYGTLPTVSRTGYTFNGWVGKNLFNIDNVVYDHYINKSNGVATEYLSSNNYKWNCSDYIEIEPGKTYTFNPNSTAGSSSTSHAVYDENKNFITAFSSGAQTMQMPSNAKYIRVSYRRSDSTNIQLEEGSQATSYEPYKIITSSTIVETEIDHSIHATWTKVN